MRLLLLLVVLGIAYKGYVYWDERRQTQPFEHAAAANPYGFVSLLASSSGNSREVLVLAPANCPSEQARQAEYLVAELNRRGIPAKRAQSISFHIENASHEIQQLRHNTEQVLSSDGPPVIIGSTGKAAATLEEIIGQYRHLYGG